MDDDIDDPDDVVFGGPSSPMQEKDRQLHRAVTGRSLASIAMDDIQAKRAEEVAGEDKIPSSFGLYARLLRMNSADKFIYIIGENGHS